jgi:hypothetical protein
MRPEDIIAEFLERLDLSKTTPQDAANKLLDVLNREGVVVVNDYEVEPQWWRG